jgi:preprotein translocase subunit SecD
MSDYFDRVEGQIMRSIEAGAASRRGWPSIRAGRLVPAISLLVALAVAVLFLGLHRSSGVRSAGGRAGVQLVFLAEPTPQSAVTRAALERAVMVMRNRADTLGVSGASIRILAGHRIDVQLPNVKNTALAERELGTTVRLEFYDWEANALTAPGTTVASQLSTQGTTALEISQGSPDLAPGAASPDTGALPLYQAVELASKEPQDITRSNAREGSEYYVFGAPGSTACATAARDESRTPAPGEHCVLAAVINIASNASPSTVHSQLASSMPAGVTLSQGQTLVVKQGTVVVQAVPSSFTNWPAFGSENTYYYVLKDNVALFGNQITNPKESTDSTGEPDVEFGFTASGASAFQRVTAQIANRGQVDSSGSETLDQHFAVALDNQLLTVSSVDFRTYPDGITGGGGAVLGPGLSAAAARLLARELQLGALPVRLKLIAAPVTVPGCSRCSTVTTTR